MNIEQVITAIFQYGGTVIMAGLFVWLFFWIISKLNKMLEDNSKMLQAMSQSNNNIAKSLDIISTNLVTIDKKIDRNYEAEIQKN